MIDAVGAHVRVLHKAAALAKAEPLDNAIVSTEVDDLEHPVERIVAAGGEFARFLGPFINQRK